MKIGKLIGDIGEILSDGIKAIDNSGIINKTVKVGSSGLAKGYYGLKGAVGSSKGFVKNHGDDVVNAAKTVGKTAAYEAGTMGKAAVNATGKTAEFIDKNFLKEAGIGESLIKRKVNKRGMALAFGGAVLAGSMESVPKYFNERQGTNDGQLYGVTPQMVNPYGVSQQMAYGSSIGQSFANNAGADGDLALALSKFKGGGMI